MGILKGITAYLCGPIENVSNGSDWRDDITPELEEMHIRVLNPLTKPSWMTREFNVDGAKQREMKKLLFGPHTHTDVSATLAKQSEFADANHMVRMTGMRLAATADIIICRLPKAALTVGTYEEIFLAKTRGTPVLFWVDEQCPSMWLYDQFVYERNISKEDISSQVFFMKCDELLETLRKIDSCEQQIDPIEWIFLSWGADERGIKNVFSNNH